MQFNVVPMYIRNNIDTFLCSNLYKEMNPTYREIIRIQIFTFKGTQHRHVINAWNFP